jgi:hypothetical protein
MRTILAMGIALAVAGCVQTSEMPLAPNVVRLQSQGRGLIGAQEAPKQTLRRAAELTLKNGYTHFRLADASMANGSEFGGYMPGTSTTNVSLIGDTAYATTTTSPGFAIRRRTTDVGVTVVMFRASEPGAKGAFDAAQVLKQTGG